MYKFAILRPITTVMFALALVFFGYNARESMTETYLPNVDVPVVVVKTIYRGGSTEIIESKITDKLEEAISTISGIESIQSDTSRGLSLIVVEFNIDKPADEATNDVRDKVSSVILPNEVDKPMVEKYSISGSPIITLFISTKAPTQELMLFSNEQIKPLLQNVRGVGNVTVVGMRDRVIKIVPHATKLNEYGIDLNTFSKIISAQNVKSDGGRVIQPEFEWSISIDADAISVDDLKSIKIIDGVRLGDVADVFSDISDERTYANMNDKNGVLLEIKKITGANEIEIANGVKELLPSLQNISNDFNIELLFDSTTFIRTTLSGVEFDLLLGCVLASLVVFIFLRNFTITIVASLALPISIFGVLALMHWSGQNLNLLTLTALTLAIGIIIDDAIVVIENIYKKLEEGKSRFEASIEGVKEIAFTILAISAMLLAVFIPIANMSGIVGKFFASFGITVVGAVVISYIVCVSVIPMVSSLIANNSNSKFYDKTEFIFVGLENLYKRALILAIRFKKSVLLVALAIFSLSITLSGNLGMVFMPKEDRSQFEITLTSKAGISIEKMKKESIEIQKVLLDFPQVEYSSLRIGVDTSIYEGSIFVRLVPIEQRSKTQHQIMDELREKFSGLKDMLIHVNDVEDIGGSGMSLPFQIVLRSTQESKVEESSNKLMEYIKSINGTVDVQSNQQQKSKQLSITILNENSAKYGVSSSDIANLIALAYSGEVAISYFRERGKEYDIVIRLSDEQRMNREWIDNLQIKNSNSQMILLSSLVEVKDDFTLSTIKRWDRQRQVTISSNFNNNLTLDKLVDDVILNKEKWLVDGVSYQLEGDAKYMQQTNDAFAVAIVAAIIMIYLILASLYESPIQPIIIMSAMPLSFTGAFIGLYLAGMSMSLFSIMGLFLLLGLVGKNSTLIVDTANHNRQKGQSLDEAVIHAGVLRLRPILMTTIAMCCGMLPLAISVGEGSAIKAPIGISVIFGLLISTVLSLFVVPAFYRLIAPFDDWARRFYTHKEVENAKAE